MRDLLMGIDFGTSGCKATVIDEHGNILEESQKEYQTYHPMPLYSEQNPEDWVYALLEVFKQIKSRSNIDLHDIKGISFSASTHNAVLLDKNMDIIRPTIMWTDQRSFKQVDHLEENWEEMIFQITGQKVTPTWTLPQLLWIKENEPENFKKIHKIMFTKDYVRYKLTGSWGTDYIDAAGSLLFDVNNRNWSGEMCDLIGLDIKTLPPVLNSTDLIGKISPELVKVIGLNNDTSIIVGSSDTAVEDYAAGGINPGQCILKLATAGNVNVILDKPLYNTHTITYYHVIPDMWYTCSATNTAASAMRWFKDNFCFQEIEESKRINENVFKLLEKEVDSIRPGSEGLLFQPYLLGERAPYWDPFLRAGFMGATMAHGKNHFLRSIMEGVAFSLKDCFRVYNTLNVEINEFIIIGGGARSEIWSQIVCDVFGKKITQPTEYDASFGSALIAGVGIGKFASLKEAVIKCNKVNKIFKPDMDKNSLYNKLFNIYLEIHDKLQPIYEKINLLTG